MTDTYRAIMFVMASDRKTESIHIDTNTNHSFNLTRM